MDFRMHEYTHALVGKVIPALCQSEKVDINDARRQHECYQRLLSELNLEIIDVDLDNNFPSNVAIEDLAVVCHGIALLMKPTSSSEEQKISSLREILQKVLGQTIVEVSDPEAKLVGSDVLFTGREFFVGMSDTTNEAGAIAVAEAFPEFPCTPIKVSGGGHLKKHITVAGPDVLCLAATQEAKELLKRMEREATFTYQTLTVPELEAANCLYVNDTLIHRAIEEIPSSFKIHGQLRKTKMRKCYFIGKISPTFKITVMEVERDEVFIENMIPRLVTFYENCVLPEIVLRKTHKNLKCVDVSLWT